jgi:aryl-alcohol dehydrogenase-like predicted oxidoreductase
MVTAALRYTLSHPAVSTVIPGAKSPEQARMNAAAGAQLLDEPAREQLAMAVG